MDEQVIILIDKERSRQFSKFIELFKARPEIPLAEIRSKIQKNAYYDFVLGKIHALNKTIKSIRPEMQFFIHPAFTSHKGKIVQILRRNCNIEIIDNDPNFFYLKLREGGYQDVESQI
jgi:hypothetical protein